MNTSPGMKLVPDYDKLSAEVLETYQIYICPSVIRQHIDHGLPIKKDKHNVVDAIFKKYVIESYIALKSILEHKGDLSYAENLYSNRVK